ncbi:hypothetical protein WJ972_05410 [Achromobacter insuavis]
MASVDASGQAISRFSRRVPAKTRTSWNTHDTHSARLAAGTSNQDTPPTSSRPARSSQAPYNKPSRLLLPAPPDDQRIAGAGGRQRQVVQGVGTLGRTGMHVFEPQIEAGRPRPWRRGRRHGLVEQGDDAAHAQHLLA